MRYLRLGFGPGPASASLLALSLLLGGSFTTRAAAAQVHAAPVFYDPSPSSRDLWSLRALTGIGLNEASGKGFSAAALVGRSISRLAVSAGGGVANPRSEDGNRSAHAQAIGQVGFRLLPSPRAERERADYSRLNIDLLAGIGYAALPAGTELQAPLGVGLAYAFESPGWSLIPWIVPHARMVRTRSDALGSATGTGLGISAGVSAGPTGGIGLLAAVGWSHRPPREAAGGIFPSSDPVTVGAGIRYRW